MENLRQYAHRLDKALAEGKPHSAYNHDIFHAFQIVLAMFKYAKQEVLLLSNKLDLTVFGNPDMLEEMEGFLRNRQGELQILVESDIDKEHPVVQLAGDKSCKISIRQIPQEEVDGYAYNFMVMDQNGFRLEQDRREPVAFAGFNDDNATHVATVLRKKFAELREKSLELSPQQ